MSDKDEASSIVPQDAAANAGGPQVKHPIFNSLAIFVFLYSKIPNLF